jgi:hypothetical protein
MVSLKFFKSKISGIGDVLEIFPSSVNVYTPMCAKVACEAQLNYIVKELKEMNGVAVLSKV